MSDLIRCIVIVVLEAGLLFVTGTASGSATYPSRPIRFIVPFTPGGASDILARAIGQKLAENWGQQIVVDNRPGAGGNIGAGIAAKAVPDGHTLLLGYVGTLAINPGLYRSVPFDTLRDFVPVTNLVSQPLLFVSHPSTMAKSGRWFPTPRAARFTTRCNACSTPLANRSRDCTKQASLAASGDISI